MALVLQVVRALSTIVFKSTSTTVSTPLWMQPIRTIFHIQILSLRVVESLSAHHSVLVIDVLETASLPEMSEDFEAKETDHQLVKDLYDIWDNLDSRNMLEDWHDAEQIR